MVYIIGGALISRRLLVRVSLLYIYLQFYVTGRVVCRVKAVTFSKLQFIGHLASPQWRSVRSESIICDLCTQIMCIFNC
jgi:hypothetical protein